MSNGYLTGCGLIFSTIVLIILFSKKTINNFETKIFKKMIIVNVLESLTTSLIVVVALTSNSIPIFKILNRIDINIILLWCLFFTLYITKVCGLKRIELFKKILIIINFIFLIISLFLNINIIATSEVLDSYGPLATFGFCGAVIYILLMLSIIILSLKNKPNMKKLVPFYFLISILILIAFLRSIIPQINFISIMFTIIDLIMYFTIENPDVKMLEEIEKNRELTEKSIEDKANMLFKITEDVKTPVSKIEILSNKIIRNNELEEIHDDARNINSLSRSVNNTINNVMDITNYDIANLKVSDISYDMNNLFKELVIMTKEKLNDNIEFSYHMSSTIPNKLYGDSLKIKQIIYTIIMNAINHTKEGSIGLNIESINRGSVCRLIIEVSDTGVGMDTYKINEILESDSNLKDEEINKIKDLDVNLKITKKMIDMLGGSLLIKSEEEEGSTFTIIINQGIVDNTSKKKNTNILSNKKKTLVICDDYQELEKLSLELKKNNYLVSTSLYGMDLVKEINNNYDLIFIDDEMKPHNAVEIMKEIGKTKEKIIIMLNKDKESIKEHYLNDYPFVDYLLKNNYKEEIKRIKDKY